MKKIFTTAILIAMALFFTMPSTILAGVNDTLVVYANGPSLDKVIGSDTTLGGLQAHSAYKLVSLDTTYIFLGAITAKSNISIVGVLGTDGRPPCIQPGVLSDNSVPQTLINLVQKGIIGKFENLYIIELSIDGTFTSGVTFNVAADSVKLYLSNVIDEENHYLVIWYSGSWDDFFFKNCKFRNSVNSTDWYASQVLSPNLYLPINPADSIVMDYNTFFCMNGATGGASYAKYVEFSHNSVLFSFIGGGAPGVFGTGKIDNNIFYGVIAGGNSKSEFTWMDDPYQPEVSSVISYDTLSLVADSSFDPADAGNSNWRMLAESKRNIEVKNNVYFMPKPITDFWTAWDDTAHTDSLYTPNWMNTRTSGMFNDKTKWPGFVQSGNLVNTDPGYGSSFADVLSGGAGYGVGLLSYVAEVRNGTVTTDEWGYKKQTVSGSNWIPTWPLPEASDMKYTNTSVQNGSTGGKPIGDPYWFNGLTAVRKQNNNIPNSFSLSQNYPNPFNPTTIIKYSLPKSGIVSLKVFNMLGQEVANLVDQQQQAGNYSVNFDATRLASGVYMYSIQTGGFSLTKKMMLLK
ncbi:MAG: T9SS type A sorting domain-containing protein [Ignavibacteriaceae bacterium]